MTQLPADRTWTRGIRAGARIYIQYVDSEEEVHERLLCYAVNADLGLWATASRNGDVYIEDFRSTEDIASIGQGGPRGGVPQRFRNCERISFTREYLEQNKDALITEGEEAVAEYLAANPDDVPTAPLPPPDGGATPVPTDVLVALEKRHGFEAGEEVPIKHCHPAQMSQHGV